MHALGEVDEPEVAGEPAHEIEALVGFEAAEQVRELGLGPGLVRAAAARREPCGLDALEQPLLPLLAQDLPEQASEALDVAA